MTDTDKSEDLAKMKAAMLANQDPALVRGFESILDKYVAIQCNQARINLLKNIKAQSHIVDTDLGERYELNRPMDFDYMIYQLELQAKETEGEE